MFFGTLSVFFSILRKTPIFRYTEKQRVFFGTLRKNVNFLNAKFSSASK